MIIDNMYFLNKIFLKVIINILKIPHHLKHNNYKLLKNLKI